MGTDGTHTDNPVSDLTSPNIGAGAQNYQTH